MSDSLRDRFQEAMRTEPAAGDPYARFVHRRRISRGLRTMVGFVLAAVTMLGFVRIFPGGTGGVPDDGFIPGEPIQPGFDPFKTFAAADLGVRLLIPADWQTQREDGSARLGGSLSAHPSAPSGLELRFGDLGDCAVDAVDACTPVTELVADPAAAANAGARVTPTRLRIGAVQADVHEIVFPKSQPERVAPMCAGCAGYLAIVGTEGVPMLVIAPDRRTLRDDRDTLRLVLETLTAR